jgi:HTH-type transcriptional regulator / antitoxin HipB
VLKTAKEFGQLVRNRRKALGWTQAELAAACGTGERFIVELESGKPSCQLEKALTAARAVGIALGDLSHLSKPHDNDPADPLRFLPEF